MDLYDAPQVMRRPLWGQLVLVLALVLVALPAHAQISGNWRDYHFIGLEELDLGAANNLPGNYAVIRAGGDILVQNSAFQLSSTESRYLVADFIKLAANSSVVDVYYGSELDQVSTSEIRGVAYSSPQLFSSGGLSGIILPTMPAAVFDNCSLSGPRRVASSGSTISLQPGCHGELEAKQNSAVELDAGTYTFKNWDIRNAVSVTALGPVTIYVRQNVRTEEGVRIKPASGDPDDVAFYVGSDSNKRSSLGAYNDFVGTFVDLNNPELNVRKKAQVTGTLIAIKVKLRSVHEDRGGACGDGIVDLGETCDPPGGFVPPANNVCRDSCTYCGDGNRDVSVEFCDDGNTINEDACRNDCSACGDGDVQTQYGEVCDDGNDVDTDDCRNDCTRGEPSCGDGIREDDEFCDDGNGNDDDDCRNDCTSCRDGEVQTQYGETCDDGNDNDDDACRNDCTFCGDGDVQDGEFCDDGNDNDDDDCRNDCTRCGDGEIQTEYDEFCDDGNDDDTDGCRNDCTSGVPSCGDGIKQGDEFCDDGDADNFDECRNDCTACGDGVLQVGETCDDGNEVDADGCRNDCTSCGDSILQAGETCDPPGSLAGPVPNECRNSCNYCGDGDVTSEDGEFCDDGNSSELDACSNSCLPNDTFEGCGDGVKKGDEFCDDGNGNDDDDCRNDCTACGDGELQVGEQCDDGNQVDDDGCSNECELPECGDGNLDPGEFCDGSPGCRSDCSKCGDGEVQPVEQCDDGNQDDSDACRNDCILGDCGDGIVRISETCDDGNRVNTDACRNDCGFCGDGIVQAVENCDDGNLDNDDGCRTNCTFCGDGEVQTQFGEVCDDANLDDLDRCTNFCLVPQIAPEEHGHCPVLKPIRQRGVLIDRLPYGLPANPSMRTPMARAIR